LNIYEKFLVAGYLLLFQIFDVFFNLRKLRLEVQLTVDIFVRKVVFALLKSLVRWRLWVAFESISRRRLSSSVGCASGYQYTSLVKEDVNLRHGRHFSSTANLHTPAGSINFEYHEIYKSIRRASRDAAVWTDKGQCKRHPLSLVASALSRNSRMKIYGYSFPFLSGIH
jgi:hypothetical protein